MLFIIIEHYKNRDAKAVYKRFQEKGRMMPEGMKYLGSWVEPNFDRCFQVIESSEESLIQKWTRNWKDLIEFEILPVLSSAEAASLNE
jgi:Protein of unknown function (DUF3303)